MSGSPARPRSRFVLATANPDKAHEIADALSAFELIPRPPGVPDSELDELNLRIEEQILTDGRVYAGTTKWNGVVGFRPAFVNWSTTREDAELVVETVRDLGSRLLATA